MRSGPCVTLLLALAGFFGRASSASLRWPLDGLFADGNGVGERDPAPATSGWWEVSWREMSFSGWFARRPSDNSSAATTATSTRSSSLSSTTSVPTMTSTTMKLPSPVVIPCFPPCANSADKVLVTPDHKSNCPKGQKMDDKGRCRDNLGSGKTKKKATTPRAKKAANGNKKIKKVRKNKNRKVRKAKKNNAKKQKVSAVKKQ